MDSRTLIDWVRDARERTFDLIADLNDEQLLGPRLTVINPLLWEIGHVAWFQEKWVLQHGAHHRPMSSRLDELYDSAAIPHETRWDLPLPGREQTLGYMRDVRDRVLERIESKDFTVSESYFVKLSVFHEDMHTEAFTYLRQTLAYPPPKILFANAHPHVGGGLLQGDAFVPSGIFMLGASTEDPFVFDNEKWAHSVPVESFAISKGPVSQAEFLEFLEEGGYSRQSCWSPQGWAWKEKSRADHPLYWQRTSPGQWQRRHFDRWVSLEPQLPAIHVNWYEAEAYSNWAGRRLPTEAEWEVAASAELDANSRQISGRKRRFPWGDSAPSSLTANLDWGNLGCIEVGALPQSDSALGCRQMIGNVWEWTADDFLPYPGFLPDPYKEYSQPWFGTHKVLRGGCWATRARLLRNTWRNFYRPERRDVWAGFRTCALDI